MARGKVGFKAAHPMSALGWTRIRPGALGAVPPKRKVEGEALRTIRVLSRDVTPHRTGRTLDLAPPESPKPF